MIVKDISSTATLDNGLKMPILGLGVYKTNDGKEVINAIHYAMEAGYRLIDTASFYKNEKGVGEAVKTAGVSREELFITTKVWNDDHGYQNTLDAFERSREKLGLEYVDLYCIHWPMPALYVETWKALEKLYFDGKVKAIGVCNFLEHHLKDVMDNCDVKPMLVQNEFHPRLIQQSLLDFCKEHNIQYQAWSPLMRGRILNNESIRFLATKYSKTAAQIVIRWDLQKGVATIPKSVHKDRIFENAAIFDFELSEDDMNLINALDKNERTGAHPDNFIEHFRNK